MTSGIAAFGTLLKIGDGGSPSENFTSIAEVTDISGPSFKTKTVDMTNHLSPGSWNEKVPTTIDPGQAKMTLNFVPTGATHSQSTGLIRDLKNKTLRNFQLIFPNAGNTTWSFAAYVTGLDLKAPVDGKLSADVTLDITGQPTLAG